MMIVMKRSLQFLINKEKADDEDIDPRWEALNKLRK